MPAASASWMNLYTILARSTAKSAKRSYLGLGLRVRGLGFTFLLLFGGPFSNCWYSSRNSLPGGACVTVGALNQP